MNFQKQFYCDSSCPMAAMVLSLLRYVGVVELSRNLPLYRGGFVSPLIRDLESRRDVLTGQSSGWVLVNATSRRSLRLLCGEYGQIECKKLYAIWREKMCTMQLAKQFQHDPQMLVKQQAADCDDQTALIHLQEHYQV